jgi:hypothetical protein
MTVRITNPSTSNCAVSGVRSSSAWAARVITTECADGCVRCQASERKALRNAALHTMLLEAMTSMRLELLSGRTIDGLRTLALILPR